MGRVNKDRKKRTGSVGRLIFRFILWTITTIAILIIGMALFLFLTFNGPSKHARDSFVYYAMNNSYISFVPTIFLDDDSINSIMEECNADNTTNVETIVGISSTN